MPFQKRSHETQDRSSHPPSGKLQELLKDRILKRLMSHPGLILGMLLIFAGCSSSEPSTEQNEAESNEKQKQDVNDDRAQKKADLDIKKLKLDSAQKDQMDEEDPGTRTSGPKTILARYERTPCYGKCPTDTLTIFKTGQAHYKGKKFVDRIGEFKGKVSEKTLERIRHVADSIGFFELEKKYDDKHTDIPSRQTVLRFNKKHHYVYDRMAGPDKLKRLYSLFNRIIEETRWKAVNE